MNILEKAKEELKFAGLDISKDNYMNQCAKNAYEMLELFAKENHSGLSAFYTLKIFNLLAKQKNLTPLTNNPSEWVEVNMTDDKKVYQSKRNPACFSEDNLKTYHNIDDKEKKSYLLEDYKCTLK